MEPSTRTRRLQPNRAPLGRYGEGGSRRIRQRRGDQNRILEAIPRWRGVRGFVQQQQHQEKGGGFGGGGEETTGAEKTTGVKGQQH